jgi:hypothetical protein
MGSDSGSSRVEHYYSGDQFSVTSSVPEHHASDTLSRNGYEDQLDASGSEGDDSLADVLIRHPYAWGTHKARTARGSILVHGKLKNCSPTELEDVQIYIWSSWATGNHGFGWNMWPESNNLNFSNTIIECWASVLRTNNPGLDISCRPIEPLLARRVSRNLKYNSSTSIY